MTATDPAASPSSSAAVGADGPAPDVSGTDLGAIRIDDSVVTKIASRAATEIADAGAAAPRILGRSIGGAGALGVRQSDLSALPKTSARVDGRVALIELVLSVRWPAPIADTTQRVRDQVRSRVQELTGLHVAEVSITVTDLVTELPRPPRVR